MWLCSWRAVTGRPLCPYPEAVEEALCFGWIDSTVNVLDDERALQLMTPRKAKSTWTRLNQQRVAAMEEAGLMTDAGRRAVDVARDNGSWTVYDQVEDLVERRARRCAGRRAGGPRQWDGFPPSARKQMLWWVISAAKDDTRRRRVVTIVEQAATGRRARG